MVGEAGIEPASPHGERILSPSCMPIPPLALENARFPRGNRYKPEVAVRRAGKKNWRRHTDSNRGIKALQASALPLGYAAPLPTHFKDIVF